MKMMQIPQLRIFLFSFLAFVLMSSSCNKNELSEINAIESISLEIPEPSGICFVDELNSLFIVSDAKSAIFRTDLSGTVTDTFDIPGHDFEGITFNPENLMFYLVDEASRKILVIDTFGIINDSVSVYGENIENRGLEGIAYNENTGNFFVLNEQNPGQLIVLSNTLEYIEKYDLNFAGDYSGICYDINNQNFWIVSEESGMLIEIDSEIKVLRKFSIVEAENEGVCVIGEKLYMVSDDFEYLHIYSKP